MKKEMSNTSNNSNHSASFLKRGSTVTLWKKKGNVKEIPKDSGNGREIPKDSGNGREIPKDSGNKKENLFNKKNNINMVKGSSANILATSKLKNDDNFKNKKKQKDNKNGSQVISKKLTMQESQVENEVENEVRNEVENEVENEVRNEVRNEVMNEVESGVPIEVESSGFNNDKVNIFLKNEIKFENAENSEKKNGEEGIKDEQSSVYKKILKKLNIDKNEQVESSHIIILGNKDVGKSSLLKALQKIALENDGEYLDLLYRSEIRVLPFDYGCLNIKNFEDDKKIHDTQGNSHVWILQHPFYTSLLIKNLNKFQNIKKIIILICTDLYKPYNIISEINTWVDVMHKIYEELYSNYDIDIVSGLKDELEKYIYNYKQGKNCEKKENREIDVYSGLEQNIDNVKNEENQKKLIKINLSFPIIFVICKSDGYEILNNRTYQGYIDVIISYLRNLAISYQGAIIFCNTINKNELINIELLYKYIMHRLYDFPFKENEILDCYEKIFIPSGYDDEKLINKSIKNTFVGNFNKPYDSIIIKPITNKTIVAEHSQNIVPAIYYNDFLSSISTNPSNDNIENEYIKKDMNSIDIDNSALSNGVRNTDKGNRNNNLDNNENNNYNSTNNENNNDKSDKFLHSFFQNLLEKGRSKSPSVPAIDPLILEKNKIVK
ncbi:hypothetical protein YYC_03486 [Plasmodium yoelii 17X]|uniref:Dynein light intermediate chain n=1 Tax=Plasmodium yoelii 17X TaxID=1323249 RepID=V7PJT5_PLAYE|nr:hypothetical protein YYC_03486 [Plasmodium yoelii 17X]